VGASWKIIVGLVVAGVASVPAAAPQRPANHGDSQPLPPLITPRECAAVDDKADSPGLAPRPATDPRSARLCSFIGKQAYRISLLERKIALLQKP